MLTCLVAGGNSREALSSNRSIEGLDWGRQATTYSPVRSDVFRNVVLVRMLWDDSSVVELRKFGSVQATQTW